jgi:hypothetical protein
MVEGECTCHQSNWSTVCCEQISIQHLPCPVTKKTISYVSVSLITCNIFTVTHGNFFRRHARRFLQATWLLELPVTSHKNYYQHGSYDSSVGEVIGCGRMLDLNSSRDSDLSSLPHHPDQRCGSTGAGSKVTPLHLVQSSRIWEDLPLHSLYAFTACCLCTGATWSFYLILDCPFVSLMPHSFDYESTLQVLAGGWTGEAV